MSGRSPPLYGITLILIAMQSHFSLKTEDTVVLYIVKRVVIIYDNSAIEPYKKMLFKEKSERA